MGVIIPSSDHSPLVSGAVSLVAGCYHTCVLMTSSGVNCWGWNGDGELGTGDTTDRYVPTAVSGLGTGAHGPGILSTFCERALLLTLHHATSVRSCFPTSHHTSFQVSIGLHFFMDWRYDTGRESLAPSTVTMQLRVSPVFIGAVAITIGWEHMCALLTGGGVNCWGWNAFGQLGTGDTTNRYSPTAVAGLVSGNESMSYV